MYLKQFKNVIFSELLSQKAIVATTYMQTRERYNYYLSKIDFFEGNNQKDYFNEIEYIKDVCLPSATNNYIFAKNELDSLVYIIIEDIIVNNQSANLILARCKTFNTESLKLENIETISHFNFSNLNKKIMYSIGNSKNFEYKKSKMLVDLYFILLNIADKNGREAIDKMIRLEEKMQSSFSDASFLIELYYDFKYYSKGNKVLEKFLIEITDKKSSFQNITDEDLIRFADPENILEAKIDVTDSDCLNIKPEYILKKCNKNNYSDTQ